MKTRFIYSAIALMTVSCTNVSENDLIDDTPLPEVITYENTVKAIIDNNCIICHSDPPENGAPMSLTSYQDVRDAVENLDLIERISSNDLDFVMPFGGPRLPQNLIDSVIEWEANGLPED